MRILLIHNFYQQPGGEDQVFHSESKLLENRGHDVLRFTIHNDLIAGMSHARTAAATVWNAGVAAEIGALVRRHRVQVAHFHNTFPLVSPAAYYAARRGGAAIVQTLHNFRLLCPAAILYRAGRVCEDCVGRLPWPALRHRCYRGSMSATAGLVAMLGTHRFLRTYTRAVDLCLTCSQFARDRFVAAGFPVRQLIAKPNFLDADPGPGCGGGGALFVGRLTEEKGVRILLDAWRRIGSRIALTIVGDGPLAQLLQSLPPGVQWLGRRSPAEVLDLMGRADMLVFPSVWYEGMPRTIIESLARGTPIVASRLGSMLEMVDDGATGRFFEPGDAADLARQVLHLSQSPQLRVMRAAARRAFETRYTADINQRLLLGCYDLALARRSRLGGLYPCH